MNEKQALGRSFILSTTLIVLTALAILLNAGMVYTWIFYSEAKKGLDVYLSDTFAKFPFIYVFALFLVFSLILLLSVILMWMRKKAGLILYLIWSFVLGFLLLFAEQIDWLNLFLLLIFCLTLIRNKSYFSFNGWNRTIPNSGDSNNVQ